MENSFRNHTWDSRPWSAGLPAYEANQYFMNSLRRYPDPSKYNSLIERLISYTQNKYLNRTNKMIFPLNNNKSNSSKRTQTFGENLLDIDSTLCGFIKDFNHYNESYDYLNASRSERPGPWSSQSIDARYLYDLKRYIKKKLKQICDDAMPLGRNDIRQRYERHCRDYHNTKPDTDKNNELSKERCSQCCQPKPCACKERAERIPFTNTTNKSEMLQNKILDWCSRLPIYLDEPTENLVKRNDLIAKLSFDLIKLKELHTIDEFTEQAVIVIETFLYQYPMWTPDDVKQKDVFKKYLINDLIQKLNEVELEPENKRNTCKSEYDILKIFDNITTDANNASKDKILKEVLERLKPLAKEINRDNNKFREEINNKAIDVLKEIVNERELSSEDKIIKVIAEKISCYLTGIRIQDSKSSQTVDVAQSIQKIINSQNNINDRSVYDLNDKREIIGLNDKSKGSYSFNLETNADFKSKGQVKTCEIEGVNKTNPKKLTADTCTLNDPVIKSEVKKIPIRKPSAIFPHKRWIKRQRGKNKQVITNSINSIELKETNLSVKDQTVNDKHKDQTIDKQSETFETSHDYEENRIMIDDHKTNIDITLQEDTNNTVSKTSSHYLNEKEIAKVVQNWIDRLSVNLDKAKDSFSRNLTSDIELMRQFKNLKPDDQDDDIKFLKYNIFKHLSHVLSKEELALVIDEDLVVGDLFEKLNQSTTEIDNEQNANVSEQVQEDKNYLNTDEIQNDFIASNIGKVVDKNKRIQPTAKPELSFTNEDLILMQRIRERSIPPFSNDNATSKLITINNDNLNTKYNENKSSFTQSRQTTETATQIEENVVKEDPKLRTINNSINKEPETNHNESYPYYSAEDDEINTGDIDRQKGSVSFDGDSNNVCKFCRLKYLNEVRQRCPRLKKRFGLDPTDANGFVDSTEYCIFCSQCGVRCPFPCKLFFHN